MNDATTLIQQAQTIITKLIAAETTEVEIAALRTEAIDCVAKMHAQMRAFAAEHGPHAANPVNRAEYLLCECLEHRTLLHE